LELLQLEQGMRGDRHPPVPLVAHALRQPEAVVQQEGDRPVYAGEDHHGQQPAEGAQVHGVAPLLSEEPASALGPAPGAPVGEAQQQAHRGPEPDGRPARPAHAVWLRVRCRNTSSREPPSWDAHSSAIAPLAASRPWWRIAAWVQSFVTWSIRWEENRIVVPRSDSSRISS